MRDLTVDTYIWDVCEHEGALYAVGYDAQLWRRGVNGWAAAWALDCARAHDLCSYNGSLFIGASTAHDPAASTARVFVFRFSPGGGVASGPEPPDIYAGMVDLEAITS
ncbi:MAG: hypothetical protein H5T86_12015 [Armatimonadetes bacterium]|nr:hypothetical protein [Armatimonadota bacterium]